MTMRFMVIVKATKESESGALPAEKDLAAMGKFNEELVKAGVMLAGEGLHGSSKGTRISYAGGKKTVVDGPFSETKELVAGFWLLQTKTKQEVIEWMKRAPFVDGEIEIRQVHEAEDFAASDPSASCASRSSACATASRRARERRRPSSAFALADAGLFQAAAAVAARADDVDVHDQLVVAPMMEGLAHLQALAAGEHVAGERQVAPRQPGEVAMKRPPPNRRRRTCRAWRRCRSPSRRATGGAAAAGATARRPRRRPCSASQLPAADHRAPGLARGRVGRGLQLSFARPDADEVIQRLQLGRRLRGAALMCASHCSSP
jgi:hypothetical protein